MGSLSIIVPTFQPGPYLIETLSSLERQTVAPSEVVVVDDGSQPPVTLPPYELSIRLLRISHAGIAGARNAGVRATTAPLVHICDHDDLLEPTFIERVVALFASEPSIDVAHSCCGYIDANGTVIPGSLPYRPPPTGGRGAVLASLLTENHIASVSAVFRRAAFLRVGGFRSLDYVQDWDFWLRLAATGSRFAHIPEVLAWHRVHPGQQSREDQRLRVLEESLDLVEGLRLPASMRLARRRTQADLHLRASRVLRARGEAGALRHLVAAWHRRPIETTRAIGRVLW